MGRGGKLISPPFCQNFSLVALSAVLLQQAVAAAAVGNRSFVFESKLGLVFAVVAAAAAAASAAVLHPEIKDAVFFSIVFTFTVT
jgi:hypothetical protein